MTFDARPYLKELARGARGARDLTREQAATLFEAVFAGEVSGVALGALLVALRVKGESLVELSGMMDALNRHVRHAHALAPRAHLRDPVVQRLAKAAEPRAAAGDDDRARRRARAGARRRAGRIPRGHAGDPRAPR